MAMRDDQQVTVEQRHLLRYHVDGRTAGQQALGAESHLVQRPCHLAQLFLRQRLFVLSGRIFVAFIAAETQSTVAECESVIHHRQHYDAGNAALHALHKLQGVAAVFKVVYCQ
ncbi:hypothetical protein D3C80_1846420 [compost metagenome]